MFDPDIHIDVPTGNLLAEIGIDPAAASEVIADERTIRCPERPAACPERRFAGLVPDLPPERGLCGKAMPAAFLPRPPRRPPGRGEGGLGEIERSGLREGVPASGRSQPIVSIQTHEEIVMAFGKNYAEVVGRLGADVSVNHLASGGRVANLSIATDESYFDKAGQKVDKTEWHRAVTFQDKLIDRLLKQAKKGRLISLEGRMQTRRWRKPGEDSDRFSTEILVVPGDRVQFYDRPNGAAMQADPAMNGHNGGPSLDDAPASLPAGLDGDIPF